VDYVATSYGPPWGGIQGSGVTADGTNLRSNPKMYGVAVDPNVIKLGTLLYIWPNPFNYKGPFKAFDTGGAIKGNRIDFYDWRGRASQNQWGRRTVKVSHSDNASTGNQGLNLPSIPNPLSLADEAYHAVVGFIKIMVDPEKLGRHLANALVWLIKQLAKGVYNVIVLPPWRWSQRSTIFYYRRVINEGGPTVIGTKAMVTMSFWAIGYAILWGRFEPVEMRGVAPEDSAFAGTINAGRNAVVARRITKPKDVDKATAKKPKPTATTIPIKRTRSVAASRRRAVKVTPAHLPGGTGVTDAQGNIIDKEIKDYVDTNRKVVQQDERDTGQRQGHTSGEENNGAEVISEEAVN
jgi:3D (Asp-Asp-Asp) domain-containing protein